MVSGLHIAIPSHFLLFLFRDFIYISFGLFISLVPLSLDVVLITRDEGTWLLLWGVFAMIFPFAFNLSANSFLRVHDSFSFLILRHSYIGIVMRPIYVVTNNISFTKGGNEGDE